MHTKNYAFINLSVQIRKGDAIPKEHVFKDALNTSGCAFIKRTQTSKEKLVFAFDEVRRSFITLYS